MGQSMTMCSRHGILGSYNGDEFWSQWAVHSSLVSSPYKRSVLSG